MTLQLRAARPEDAERLALLHADSWRRHYRGSYADSYLDGDIVSERHAVWAAQLADPGDSLTLLAEDGSSDGTGLVGFIHVVFDEDKRYGSFVANLHVTNDRRRGGTGTALLTRAAEAVSERFAGPAPLYLWVLELNTAAQQFYRALGGSRIERTPVTPPGGIPGRLNGAPNKLRITWTDAAAISHAARRRNATLRG